MHNNLSALHSSLLGPSMCTIFEPSTILSSVEARVQSFKPPQLFYLARAQVSSFDCPQLSPRPTCAQSFTPPPFSPESKHMSSLWLAWPCTMSLQDRERVTAGPPGEGAGGRGWGDRPREKESHWGGQVDLAQGRPGLELVPLLVLVPQHDLVSCLGKVLCLVHHSCWRVIQLTNLLTPLCHQLKEKSVGSQVGYQGFKQDFKFKISKLGLFSQSETNLLLSYTHNLDKKNKKNKNNS